MNAHAEPQGFLWSDGWILLSILYADANGSGAGLKEIIAAGDFINHAILTRGELGTGLARLLAAGYLTREANGFSPADVVRSFWSEAFPGKRHSVSRALDAVSRFIGAAPAAPGCKLPETVTERYVSKAEYDAAVRDYQKESRRFFKRSP